MRAATIVERRIVVTDHPDPVPGHGEILVAMRAAGLNAADLIQVMGAYPAPPGSPQDIPGMEIAGEVVAIGAGVTRWQPGDRVMAVVGGGAQAARLVLHERLAVPVPDGMTWEEAGGFPEAFTTAHDALFTQAGLAMGEGVLVSGAAGGVGTAGVQLAAAAGARVTGSVRDPARRPDVASLGAEVIDPGELRHHGPFDVILELVGAPNMAANLDVLATHGRIAVIGVGAGAAAEINLMALMTKRARIHGSTLRARPLEAKADAARRIEVSVLPLVAAGRIRVPVTAAFPLERAGEAYERFRAGGKFGKVVLLNAE
ncbi:MAG TPA: zinc-binding dehydrogenase [Acidimicrobiales bacterium]